MREYYMKLAINEAKKAMELDEAPIGAVIVKDGAVLSSAHNLKESLKDSTAHAEMIAIREASKAINGWRLIGSEMYVTLEPCPMCAGAILQARINVVYFGANDPKAGCAGTLYNLLEDSRFNHRAKVYGGVLEDECRSLLSNFFKGKR